ncbi:MAG TPA: hypothetical protein VGQ79_05675 [Nitrospiraceae bacterium]|jgi:hypothetical protein|nr:hypothetical protein [Nitrospiraceae bacterium]
MPPYRQNKDDFDIKRTMDKELLRVGEAADFLSVTALVSGWNCTARVDCGQQRLTTIQEEGKS